MLFVWIYLCKSEFSNKFKPKINCRSQKAKVIVSSRINSTSKINYNLNHPNIIKSIPQSLESHLTL